MRVLRSIFTEAASTLPEKLDGEVALMDLKEFLKATNPGNKHHESGSYDVDIADLNAYRGKNSPPINPFRIAFQREPLWFQEQHDFVVLSTGDSPRSPTAIQGVIHDKTLYYRHEVFRKFIEERRNDTTLPSVSAINRYVARKNIASLVEELSANARKPLMLSEFPVLVQQLRDGDEVLFLRAEGAVKPNKGTTLALINKDNYVVAQASNEWGATLIRVAKEYRGKGLGKLIGKYWYENNPKWESGGYTPEGERTAIARWRDRVREFSANGFYTALVKSGAITLEKVKTILKQAGVSAPKEANPVSDKGRTEKGELLVYVGDGGLSFVVYDSSFYTEQTEKFIYGYGFFRGSATVGVFVRNIDYDDAYEDVVTRVALQIAKDNDFNLYVGEGYHDWMEWQRVPGVVQEGDHIDVTRDVYPLEPRSSLEKLVRKKRDRYGELLSTLLEMAESKWS